MNTVPLPDWCRLIRADNPGPMTLDGTNTYVLRTTDGNVVVDPGPLLDDHLSAVLACGPVRLTVLTHHHPDHAESAARFHELTGAPVAARDSGLCLESAPLDDDARIDAPGLDLRVLHTPGHTADSICLDLHVETETGTWRGVLSGDTVLGRGTTVVAHPDGRLGEYLASLRMLRARLTRDHILLPAHGPVRLDARDVVDEYLAHRRARLEEVRKAIRSGARTAHDVVRIVYADVDPALWPAAERTVAAALDYLADAEPDLWPVQSPGSAGPA